MAEYIDKEAAIQWLEDMQTKHPRKADAFGVAKIHFKHLPAADVRPVVTCEECTWHVDDGSHYCNKWCQHCPDNAEFYCAYGERPNCGAEIKSGGD